MQTNWRTVLLSIAAGALGSALALGQNPSPCPTEVLSTTATMSKDLVCLIPQVYGAGGLVGTGDGGPLDPTMGHSVHFQASSLSSFGPINSEIGIELSQLPLAAPVAGFIFAGGVITPTSTFGPILSDRAETLGKGKVFIGASYQYFNFDKADGVNLRNFNAVFTHELEPLACPEDPNDPLMPCVNGEPLYTQDIVATVNRVDLKVHQITLVGTVGIFDRFDVAIAVPVLDVRMAMASQATIFSFEPAPFMHQFSTATGGDTSVESFAHSSAAEGLGDITFRAKYTVKVYEHAAVAAGADFRLPTGDPKSFLGSGTWGFRPFVIYTAHLSKFSPHMTVGFQGNGESILAGDITAATPIPQHLPDVVSYTGGVDGSITPRFGYAVDLIGQSVLQATRIQPTTFTDYLGNKHANITASSQTIQEFSASAGVKASIAPNLLLTANGLFRLNDAGLHSKTTPLIGLSYVF